MRSRIVFDALLVDALGSENVYFQPPEGFKMSYPCIKYSEENPWIAHANNNKYVGMKRYSVIYMSYDPDSDEVRAKLDAMPYSSFERTYAADNLNHFVYTIFY